MIPLTQNSKTDKEFVMLDMRTEIIFGVLMVPTRKGVQGSVFLSER